jgi:hypothetical protein
MKAVSPALLVAALSCSAAAQIDAFGRPVVGLPGTDSGPASIFSGSASRSGMATGSQAIGNAASHGIGSPGSVRTTTIGNVSSHTLGNGVTGRSIRFGAITGHSFSNGVTGTSYHYGSTSTHHFSNGISGATFEQGNQSTTRLTNARTITCHNFASATNCR